MMLEIKHETNDFSFVAIIMNETTSVGTKSQLSTVIHNVKKDGSIEESFFGI